MSKVNTGVQFIKIHYWCNQRVPDLKHNDLYKFNKDLLSDIIIRVLDIELNYMIQLSGDKVIIHIDNKLCRQR